MKKIAYLFLLIVFSCTNNTTNKVESDTKLKDELKLSQIVFEATNGYFYYLPASYTQDKEFPVIIFFDPHAIGDLPLKKYKQLAERFGYIIIGSKKSMNGLAENDYFSIYKAIRNDIGTRFSIDDKRIYAGGFSGGARVASMIAMSEGGIVGVIACGAGLSQQNIPIQTNFNYISFAGDHDFNYVELKQLKADMAAMNIKNQFIEFVGKHEWPADSFMIEAFYWIETNAMRDSLKIKDESLLKEIKEFYSTKLEKSNGNIQKYIISGTLINYLEGLTDIENARAITKQLTSNSEVIRYLGNEKKEIEDELSMRAKYAEYLSKKELSWWDGEIKRIKAQTDIRSARLLNYLSLMFYMSIENALKQNAVFEAGEILELYQLADPENMDVYYLKACYYAMSGDAGAATEEMNMAIEKGFNDWNKMKNDPRLSLLRESDLFLYH